MMHVASRQELIEDLVAFFAREGFPVHGAVGIEGTPPPPVIPNQGFGDGRPRRPDVVAVDPGNQRILFGLAKPDRRSLDSESSLTEYNIFLDHKWDSGLKASVLYVAMPADLVAEFTSIITHYIHREYWHRIVPVASRGARKSGT